MKDSSQEFAQDTKHLFCFCPWLDFPLSHINTSFLLLALSNTRSAQVSEWRLDEWMDSLSHVQENIVSVPDYSFHFLIFQAFSLPSFVFFLNFLLFSSFLLSFSYLSFFFFSLFYSFHIFFSQSGCNLKQNQRLGSWNDLGKISSTFWKVVEDSLGCIIFSGRVEGDFFTLFSTSEWIYFWFIFNCGCFFYVNMVTENYNLSFHKH